jgi:phytoene dehydrogenase-like protein
MRVLVLFGTSEGHTHKIARFLSDRFSGQGHQVTMADARDLPVDLDPVSHDLVIIAARVHAGSYPRAVLGLALGCYAQMNGYKARILEMSSRPGGVCTSWARDGYTFDGCIHNLAGSSAQSAFHHIWRELGVVPQIEMRPYDELVRVERSDGEALTVYTDLDRLEAHLKQLSPSDGAVIDDIIGAARRLAHFDLMGLAVASPLQRIRSIAYAPACLKWGRITLKQYASRFTDPFLRRAFPTLVYDWPDQPMLILLSFLGRCGLGDLGWPVGGSAALAGALERRFRELGGDIEYDKTVQYCGSSDRPAWSGSSWSRATGLISQRAWRLFSASTTSSAK